MFAGFVTLDNVLVGSMIATNTLDTPVNSDAAPTFRVYGPNGYLTNGQTIQKDTGSLTNATHPGTIVITSSGHGLTTGARVTLTGVTGNTAANGTFVVTRIDANSFSLNGSSGSAPYSSGGTWNVTGLYEYRIQARGVAGFEKGESYQIVFTFAIGGVQKGLVHSFNVT